MREAVMKPTVIEATAFLTTKAILIHKETFDQLYVLNDNTFYPSAIYLLFAALFFRFVAFAQIHLLQ
jgi:hypothetical protein